MSDFKIENLDEFQGLTKSMVENYIISKGWKIDKTRAFPILDQQNGELLTPLFQGLNSADVILELVYIEQRSPQIILREINPRWRIGHPSQAAIETHNGPWLCRCCKTLPVVVEAHELITRLGNCLGTFEHWPCDREGNRTRYPTNDANNMVVIPND